MSTRRPHTKSRWGCKRCKVRRMKCDEVHPTCGACVKASVQCDYGLLSSAPKLPRAAAIPSRPKADIFQNAAYKTTSSSSTPTTTSLSSAVAVAPDGQARPSPESNYTLVKNGSMLALNMSRTPSPSRAPNFPPEQKLEMRLFHHYVAMTHGGESVAMNAPARSIWTNWIVTLALETPHLMDGLLGFAAFHLQHHDKTNKVLREAAHRYMLKAVVEHRKQVQKGINSENADAVFATSSFIAFHVQSGRAMSDHNGSLVHWFQPWEGIKTMLAACWMHFKSQDIKIMILVEQTRESGLYTPYELETPLEPFQTFDFLLADLDREKVDTETLLAYTTSVESLNRVFRDRMGRHVMKFTAMVSKRFVEFVGAKDPRTMTIVGYFLMVVKQIDLVWWLQGAADRDFAILMEGLPDEWKPRMAWAVNEFQNPTRPAGRTKSEQLARESALHYQAQQGFANVHAFPIRALGSHEPTDSCPM
ncbi:hypothetical protein B0J14DRAFT_294282 [Halenospora varia]|nr:hypothetical protein B0J14DRAFT_294282 [Halenospora varia]